MKTTKHTPGPWAVDLTPSAINVDSNMGGICQVFGADNPDDETMPNARLIAKAPELLAMVERMAEALEERADPFHNDPLAMEARAAIAQATGEK